MEKYEKYSQLFEYLPELLQVFKKVPEMLMELIYCKKGYSGKCQKQVKNILGAFP